MLPLLHFKLDTKFDAIVEKRLHALVFDNVLGPMPEKRFGQTEIPVFITALIPAYLGELNECRLSAAEVTYFLLIANDCFLGIDLKLTQISL